LLGIYEDHLPAKPPANEMNATDLNGTVGGAETYEYAMNWDALDAVEQSETG
jgi:hypothetical protein